MRFLLAKIQIIDIAEAGTAVGETRLHLPLGDEDGPDAVVAALAELVPQFATQMCDAMMQEVAELREEEAREYREAVEGKPKQTTFLDC